MSYEKYLFLDVDGVLITQRSWLARHRCNALQPGGYVFDNIAIDFLSLLFKTDPWLRLVLCSQGWARSEDNVLRTRLVLQKHSLYYNIPDIEGADSVFCGPHAYALEKENRNPSRYEYLEQYLKWYPAKEYIILDDMPPPDYDTPIRSHWWHINIENGIQAEDMRGIFSYFGQEQNANTGYSG